MDSLGRTSIIGGIGHNSLVQLEVRDGITGELKQYRECHNYKLTGTFAFIVSALTTSAPFGGASTGIMWAGIASGDLVTSSDSSLSGETWGRTLGRKSFDAGSPNFNLSFSWSNQGASVSVAQIGLSYTVSVGAILYLKASFARLTLNSQDILNVAWLQSFASVNA